MTTPLPVVPIKSFGVAKQRLAPVLDAGGRSRVGMAIALRTLEMLNKGITDPMVVTADDDVASWAQRNGYGVLHEPGDLNAAARAGADHASAIGRPWMVVHADLPLATGEDFGRIARAMNAGPVITPSRDGGTNVIGGNGPFSFSYGRGSFHRHLKALTPPVTVDTSPRLVTDLDAPIDFEAILAAPSGSWLRAEVDF